MFDKMTDVVRRKAHFQKRCTWAAPHVLHVSFYYFFKFIIITLKHDLMMHAIALRYRTQQCLVLSF